MASAAHEYDRFLRIAHRRWVAWRVIERAATATLWACALALPLITVMWFRGARALPVALFTLGIGAILGAIWGVIRRPTLLETAIEVDRQFDLHDLLGTALTLSCCACTDDATRAAIRAAADVRCRRLASSRMVLNHLGARAWAGIGLANALIITLSLMTTSPTATIAQVEDQPTSGHRFDKNSYAATSIAAHRAPQTLPRGTPAPTREGIRTTDADGDADGSRSAARSPSGASTAGDGTGAGGAQTRESASRAARATASGRDSTTGRTPAGGAADAASASGNEADAVSAGVTRAVRSSAPPWRAPTWDADRARALRDVERGAVPDRYRDVIRAYFDHDESTDRDAGR